MTLLRCVSIQTILMVKVLAGNEVFDAVVAVRSSRAAISSFVHCQWFKGVMGRVVAQRVVAEVQNGPVFVAVGNWAIASLVVTFRVCKVVLKPTAARVDKPGGHILRVNLHALKNQALLLEPGIDRLGCRHCKLFNALLVPRNDASPGGGGALAGLLHLGHGSIL